MQTEDKVKLFTYTGDDISELNLNGEKTLITTTSQKDYDDMAFNETMTAKTPAAKIKVTT